MSEATLYSDREAHNLTRDPAHRLALLSPTPPAAPAPRLEKLSLGTCTFGCWGAAFCGETPRRSWGLHIGPGDGEGDVDAPGERGEADGPAERWEAEGAGEERGEEGGELAPRRVAPLLREAAGGALGERAGGAVGEADGGAEMASHASRSATRRM